MNLHSFLIVSRQPEAGDTTAAENFMQGFGNGAKWGNADRPDDFHFDNRDGEMVLIATDFDDAWRKTNNKRLLAVYIDLPTADLHRLSNGFYVEQVQRSLFFCPVDCHDPESKGNLGNTYWTYGPFFRRFFSVTTKRPTGHANFNEPCTLEIQLAEPGHSPPFGTIYWNPIPLKAAADHWHEHLKNRNFLGSDPVALLPPWDPDAAEKTEYFSSPHLRIRRSMRSKLRESLATANRQRNLRDAPAVIKLWELADNPLFRDALSSGGELDLNLAAQDSIENFRSRKVRLSASNEIVTQIVFRPGFHTDKVKDYTNDFFLSLGDNTFSNVGKFVTHRCREDIRTSLGNETYVILESNQSSASVIQPFDMPTADADNDETWLDLFSQLNEQIGDSREFRSIYEKQTRSLHAYAKLTNKCFMPTAHAWRNFSDYWYPRLFEHHDFLNNEFIGRPRSFDQRLRGEKGFPRVSNNDDSIPMVQMGNTLDYYQWISVAHIMPLGTRLRASGQYTLNGPQSKLNSKLVLG